MKKGVGLLFSMLILAATLTGCISMTPLSDAGAFPGDAQSYEVLGRVEVKSSATNSGYSKLYAEAKKKYPECDDVVNVKVDAKKTVFLIFTFNSYNMSGIAISYK